MRLIHDLSTVLGLVDEKIDIVVLNDAHLEMKYRVRIEGIVVFERDTEKRIDFETNTLKAYLDFSPTWIKFMKSYWRSMSMARLKDYMDQR